jgi:hypothetical protein
VNDYELLKLQTVARGAVDDATTMRFLRKAKALLGEARFAEIMATEAVRRIDGHFTPANSMAALTGLLLKIVAEDKTRVATVNRDLAARATKKEANVEAEAKRNATNLSASEIIAAPMPTEADTPLKQRRQGKARFLRAVLLEQDPASLTTEHMLWASPAFVQTTLPHRDPKTESYSRTNGVRYLDMVSGRREGGIIGLPYGPKPRLLLHYCAARIQASKTREIELPNTLFALHKELGLADGESSYRATAEQAIRLFSAFFTTGECSQRDAKGVRRFHANFENMVFADKVQLAWAPDERQLPIFDSFLVLSENMTSLLRDRPFPLRKQAIRALQQSSFSLDVYAWLCWRNFILHSKGVEGVVIPVVSDGTSTGLMEQFGSNYAEPKFFIRQLERELAKVRDVWVGRLNVSLEGRRLTFKRSDQQTETPKFYLGGGR